jgi:hypothetical protein
MPPARGGGEGRVQYDIAETLNGIELTSLERVNTDFVGLVVSKLSTAQGVGVELEFRCSPPDAGSPRSCQCTVPAIQVPPNGRAEFLCTPEGVIQPGVVDVMVRLRAR